MLTILKQTKGEKKMKETMITLRVTKLEREHLKQKAKEAGFKTVSEYIRVKVGLNV